MSTIPPIWNTLIDQVKLLRFPDKCTDRDSQINNNVVDACIAIIRQHQTDEAYWETAFKRLQQEHDALLKKHPAPDVVKRVADALKPYCAKVLHPMSAENERLFELNRIEAAKAALAALNTPQGVSGGSGVCATAVKSAGSASRKDAGVEPPVPQSEISYNSEYLKKLLDMAEGKKMELDPYFAYRLVEAFHALRTTEPVMVNLGIKHETPKSEPNLKGSNVHE